MARLLSHRALMYQGFPPSRVSLALRPLAPSRNSPVQQARQQLPDFLLFLFNTYKNLLLIDIRSS